MLSISLVVGDLVSVREVSILNQILCKISRMEFQGGQKSMKLKGLFILIGI